MSTSSWLGSVWSLRGQERLLIGEIRAIDGEQVTLSVVGLGEGAPDGMELLPVSEAGNRLARVKSATLLVRWTRMGGESGAPA
ncbi:MAG: hypothetical protein WB493_02370 [Anaeromyxobacteraceae bacterium]